MNLTVLVARASVRALAVGVNGEPRPPWFPFQPSYWGFVSEKKRQQIADDPGLGKPPTPYLAKTELVGVSSSLNADAVAVGEDEVRSTAASPGPIWPRCSRCAGTVVCLSVCLCAARTCGANGSSHSPARALRPASASAT